MDNEYFDYEELDDSEITEDGGEGEEEERLHEMLRQVCSIITELVQELNDLLEKLLKEL